MKVKGQGHRSRSNAQNQAKFDKNGPHIMVLIAQISFILHLEVRNNSKMKILWMVDFKVKGQGHRSRSKTQTQCQILSKWEPNSF